MAKRFLETITLTGLLALALPAVSAAQTLPATITVNAASTVTSFIPISIFGNNTAYWISKANNYAVSQKVQQAGNYFLRYPGGSSSDVYHWNGTGSFNASGDWVPNNTTYSAGFADNPTYVGTGTASNITSSAAASIWLSNADTDFPNDQWIEFDLAASTSVNAVSIVWGNPYAAQYEIQYWTGNNNAPYSNSQSVTYWVTTSSGLITGSGGTTVVSFTAQSARYWRIEMTASSGGATGAYSVRKATLLNGTTAESTSGTQIEVSSTDPASTNSGWTPDFDFETYMTELNSFSPKGISLITVNFGTGTSQEAAAWVNYANKIRGYGIKYWQIGNETEGNWETGGPIRTQDYVRRYIEYYNAMKAVDPTIIITGPVAGGFFDSDNMNDGQKVVQKFIGLLHSDGLDANVNAIDYHWYPYFNATNPLTEFGTVSQVQSISVSLTSYLSGTSVSPTIPVIMSEYNIDPKNPSTVLMNQMPTALWMANSLGEFIHYFGAQGYTNFWDTLNGSTPSDTTNNTVGDEGYLQVDAGTYQYQPHATYWAMQIMTNDWAINGDANTHQLVNSGSSAATLATYADYRPDGILSLIVINKDVTNTYDATLNLNGYNAATTATGFTFNSANYAWETTASPYHASPDNAASPATFTGVSNSFPATFGPYSMTVLHFIHPIATPTPSFTAMATATGTPTATATSTPTLTLSSTPTATMTSTPTDTWTVTPTGSWNTSTPTDTPTLTPSSTPTSTPTLTPSVTPTTTPSLTPTSSSTSTQTLTPTLTSTPTITLTPTITNTFTWTPTPAAVNLLYPNPVYGNIPVNFNYNVTSPVDQVKVKLFTLSFRKIYEDDSLPTAVGQDSYTLDFGKAGLNLANGLYYVVLYWKTGDQETHQVMKLLVQR